ncbi:TetR/AcrR family transcriptional regulator [Amycolatopsis albispora]|uniref:HTH tetR-type domain-containing protein n=1 Tax=Amycolatopsis albispora TaxID=1804986 RepID=A0A344L530_9PSEU|nr:TetR/AcrR family transcriptional regulator [Amycolatopsis albispora]AXB43154.1 hypothetical protein A4R43_11820 [Amycolatopsis albispora]
MPAASRSAQIAATAAELFCARGYHNVGVTEIAAALGLTGPAIYRHFPGKRAILVAAIGDLCEGVAAAVEGPAGGCGPAGERLDEAFRALVELSLQRRTAARLYQWEGRHLSGPEWTRLAGRIREVLEPLRGLLRQARPELSKPEASLLVRAALSVVVSPSTHRATLSRAKARETLLDCCRTVLAATGLPPADDTVPPSPSLDLLPRRERLLAEAVRLFHRDGYHAVAMEDVGAAAGINSSGVYRHFASKPALLAAIYHRAAGRVELVTVDALTALDAPGDPLERLVRGYTELTYGQAELAGIYLAEHGNLPEADRAELHRVQRRQVDVWLRLTEAERPGDSPGELRFRVHAALNVITDLARVRRPHGGPAHAEHLVLALLRR